MEWTFLVNCADEFEASLIIGILEQEGITSQTKYKGSGDYMKIIGGVGKNVDIYVPADKHSQAMAILASLAEEVEPEE